MNYFFKKSLDISFENAVDLVKKHLNEHKFGVLTTIDVKDKFKEKLGIDFKKYVILGACNPANAHKAIETEENIGLMLPCNVIIYEKDDKSVVAVIRPTVAMGMIENEELSKIAEEVEGMLKQCFDAIQ